MSSRLVTELRFADAIRVHPQTIYEWRVARQLVPDEEEKVRGGRPAHSYRHSTINTFLADRWRHTDRPAVTLAELLDLEGTTQSPSLLTIDEAMERLSMTNRQVRWLLEEKELGHFALSPNVLRIPVHEIIKLIAKRADEGQVLRSFAAKMLGVHTAGIGALVRTEQLEGVKVKGIKEQFVTTASLHALIAELVGGGTADEWWDTRLRFNFDPLLTKNQIRREWRVDFVALTLALENGEMLYIRTPGTAHRPEFRIPRRTARIWSDRRQRLTPDELAALLGIQPKTASARGFAHGLCGRHAPRLCPNRNCLATYIERHQIGDEFTAADWFAWIEQDKRPAVSSDEIVATVPGTLTEDLCTGVVRGILLPNGTVAVAGVDARAYQRRMTRLMDREDWRE